MRRLAVLAVISLLLILPLHTNVAILPVQNIEPQLQTSISSTSFNKQLTTKAEVYVPTDKFYVYDVRGENLSVKLLVTTLQGLVNREKPRLYLIYTNLDWELVKRIYHENLGIEYENLTSLSDVLKLFGSYVKTYVIPDTKFIETVNLATIYCGLNDGIIVSEELYDFVVSILGEKPVIDLRNKFDDDFQVAWTILLNATKFLKMEANRTFVAYLYGGIPNLRDFLVSERILVVGTDMHSVTSQCIADRLFKTVGAKYVLGFTWPAVPECEATLLKILSENGMTIIVSDYMPNLSFHSKFKLGKLEPPKPYFENVTLEDKVYVSFVYSDGDNLAYLNCFMYDVLWKPEDVPIAFTINPYASILAPALMKYYYETAPQKYEFVAGVSMFSYTWLMENKTAIIQRHLDDAIKAKELSGLDIVVEFGDRDFESLAFVARYYTGGVMHWMPWDAFYLPNNIYYRHPVTVNGTPIVFLNHIPCSLTLGGRTDKIVELVKNITENVISRPLFIALYVDVWSGVSPDRIKATAEALEEMGCEVVGIHELMRLIKEYYSGEKHSWKEILDKDVLKLLPFRNYQWISLYSSLLGGPFGLLSPGGFVSIEGYGTILLRDIQPTELVATASEVRIKWSLDLVDVEAVVSVKSNPARIEFSLEVRPKQNVKVSVTIPVYDCIEDVLRLYDYDAGLRKALSPLGLKMKGANDLECLDFYQGWVIIFDEEIPWAVGVYVREPDAFIIRDSFNPNGDADGDGIPEFHCITVTAGSTEKGQVVRIVGGIVPLSYHFDYTMNPAKLSEELSEMKAILMSLSGCGKRIRTLTMLIVVEMAVIIAVTLLLRKLI